MRSFDVFNGDADGLCALHQLRLAEPREAELVTGVKRDIELLARVDATRGDRVTVLDISLDVNRAALLALLDRGVRVTYFDHHYAGELPQHAGLDAVIDTAAHVCTSILVDQRLAGRYRPWAVVAAFGDNLHEAARELAECLKFAAPELSLMRELGEYLNYNAYGESIDDLWFAPTELFSALRPYANPLEFIHDSSAFARLRAGYAEDIERALAIEPALIARAGAIYSLPDASWARRVSGVFGNEVARRFPERAHAILTHATGGGFVVSVRAPIATRKGADELCRRFPSGGGRAAAAGINHLPEGDLSRFSDEFATVFG